MAGTNRESCGVRIWRTNALQDITFTRGSGCWVFDAGGKPYLDLLSGTWCNVLGYGHPRWTAAVSRQLSELTHVGAPFLTDAIGDALHAFAQILPPALNRAVFLNTGSEAVELSLKMARAATGAEGVAVIERSYYGATIHALSLSEAGRTASYLPAPGAVFRLPAPDCQRCAAGRTTPCTREFPCLDPLEALALGVQDGRSRVAAVLYEPVLANGGVIVPPIGYGARLRELASGGNMLLIAEEVTTGMGRTGRWFGYDHDDIVPDLLVIGKAIGAGFPVSVVVTTEDVEARCQGRLTHVQSHQNDPLSGRVAATVISILQDEQLVERAAERGRELLGGLSRLQARGPWIRQVRGRGLMVGIELDPAWAKLGTEICSRLLASGFIVNYQPHNAAFRLFPPYVISSAEIQAFLEAFETALREICQIQCLRKTGSLSEARRSTWTSPVRIHEARARPRPS